MDIVPRQEHVSSTSAHHPSSEMCIFYLPMGFLHPLSSASLPYSEMVTYNQEIEKEHLM